MSINFKCFCQQIINKNIVILLGIFAFLHSGFAFSDVKENNKENASLPRYRYYNYYVLYLENIPIGTAIASTGSKKTSLPNETIVNISSRMGVSPMTSQYYVNTHSSKGKYIGKNPFSVQEKIISFSDQYLQNNNSTSDSNLIFHNENSFSTNLQNLFFEPKGAYSLKETLTPFPKDFFNFNDTFEATYGNDHFLKQAFLKLNNDISFEVRKINKRQYFKLLKKLSYSRLDIGLIASFEDQMDEVDRLVKTLSLCQAEMGYLNKSILKKMPHESYLMYRRIINLTHFCENLKKEILANDADETNEIAFKTQQQVLELMRENSLELPHAISDFSERTLFYNQNMIFLWPRMTTLLIQDAVKEMQNLFNLDYNRKSLLGIKLRIKSLQPRSVVRADITQIKSFVDFKVQNHIEKNASYFLDGVTFGNNIDYNIGNICSKNGGQVGIDLTDPKQSIVNSVGIRGIWDNPTKLKTARAFAMQAVSNKNCQKIYFKASPILNPFLNHELNVIKKEFLSKESSLLLSNYRYKNLWVMPGKYKITISSVKNEKVISIQEFTVNAKTHTNIIANVQ